MSVRKITMFALSALSFCAATVQASELLVNGGFENGGGSLSGWVVADQAGGSGSWFLQTGTGSPLNGFSVPAPPGPTHAAMTDQGGPGSHVLLQSFVVPTIVTSAILNFDYFISNQGGAFITPASLDFAFAPNQQARVDIITAGADPFSLAVGDILANIYQTQVGDPLVSGYNTINANLTALFAAHAGETLVLRFSEVDNQLFFNNGVDNVSLDVASSALPEPGTLPLLGLAVVGAGLLRRRKPA